MFLKLSLAESLGRCLKVLSVLRGLNLTPQILADSVEDCHVKGSVNEIDSAEKPPSGMDFSMLDIAYEKARRCS